MEINFKALEAALESAEPKKDLVSRLGQQEAYRQYGEKAIQVYIEHPDADLVERSGGWTLCKQLEAERDEARRKLAEMELGTDELLVAADAKMYQQGKQLDKAPSLAETRGTQLAALREALEEWYAVYGVDHGSNLSDRTKAILTDTAEAAAGEPPKMG